jgi:nitrite reductase/ring-hydroxylating ferredoxin subunit
LINQQQPDEEGYYLAALTAEVEDGRMTAVILNNSSIILTRIGQTIYAFSAQCPHASGDLTRGELHRGRIDCPEHGYRFDIRSGFPVWPPDEVCRLKKFPVKEQDGRIYIKM